MNRVLDGARFAAGILFLACVFRPVPAFAAPVVAVDFEKSGRLATHDLARMVTVHQGDEYSPAEVERSRRLLEATGLFRSVEIETREEPEGYRILFRADPYQLIEKVSLTGNFLMLKKNLTRLIRLRKGESFREEAAREDVAGLLSKYEQEGYFGTQVRIDVEERRKGVRVTYRVEEGKPGIVRKFEFDGNQSLTDEELTSHLRLVLLTFYRQENLVESVDRLERFYREQGFLDVVIESDVVSTTGVVLPAFTLVDPVKGLAALLPGQYVTIDIIFRIVEGKKYRIDFQGNEAFAEEELKTELSFTETGFFDQHEAQVGRRRLLSFYRKKGYYRADVEVVLDRESGTVTYTIREGEPHRVRSVKFRGAKFFSDEWLASRIKTWGKGLTAPRMLRHDYLEEDSKRIRDFYRYEGFLDVEVPASMVVFGESGTEADVVFTVNEGVRTLVGWVTFTGVSAVAEDELRRQMRTREENPFRPGWVTRDKEKILQLIGAHGYPDCRIRERVIFSEERDRADVYFVVDEGEHFILGKVLVVGNRKTKDKAVIREFPLRLGDPYRIDAITEGRRNLYGLGFFRKVDIRTPRPVEGLEERDVIVQVQERSTGLFRVGGGVDSDEGVRGFVEVGEQNLFGMGRGLSLRAKVGTVERRYDLFYREPWPFGYEVNSEADIFEEFRDEQGYDTTRRGVNLGVKEEFAKSYTVNLKYRLEFVDYQDVTLESDDPELAELESINITSVIGLFGYDLRDSPVLPHRGSYHLIGVEVATPVLGGDTRFNKYTFETSWFFPIGGRSELALGLRGGFAHTLVSFDELPLSERFFLGGARGVRGYPEDEVGPKDAIGNPVGGDTYALGIAELRFPLGKKNWRAVTFLDYGNVWSSGIEPTEGKVAVGLGLRYNTPVGPLRLDYGLKVDPEANESPGRFHFSIGFPL